MNAGSGPANIVLRDPARAEWLVFRSPTDLLVARDPGEIMPLLHEAAQRTRADGLYAAGYLAYEAASAFDDALATHPGEDRPLACFGLYRRVERRKEFPYSDSAAYSAASWSVATSRRDYEQGISAIRRQIALGNTYQVNYTVRLCAADTGDPLALFRHVAADARYAAWLDFQDFAIVSASPELFFEKEGESIRCRPMKGTARRGMTTDGDERIAETLYESAKNRAENVMITDMIRNDLGRVAVPGSVTVESLYDLEKYPTVWQLTSTVSARSTAGVPELFAALFPCASVTGAPKSASMGIIADLETSPRGIYTGAIGFIGPDEQARFSVAIRTATIDKRSGSGVYGTGGGIVWDSNAEDEYRECRDKARVLEKPVAGPGFHLLETLRWTPGSGYFLLDEHLTRLQDSARYFDYHCDRGAISDLLREEEKSLRKSSRIRLLLSPDGTCQIECHALVSPVDSSVRVKLAHHPVDPDDPFLYHKTTQRDAYEAAANGISGCDDVILWNPDNEVTESTIANIMVRLGSHWYTPPVAAGLLAGTMRRHLLETTKLRERRIQIADLRNAEEIRLANSVRGSYPAVLVDG